MKSTLGKSTPGKSTLGIWVPVSLWTAALLMGSRILFFPIVEAAIPGAGPAQAEGPREGSPYDRGALWASASGEGKKVYEVNCVNCHGAQGKGDGLAAARLNPKPRPFSESLAGKKDEELATVITQGKGQMPGWGHVLKPDQVSSVLQYVKSLSRP